MHSFSAPVAWSQLLRFAAPRPSGEVAVRVGRRYLLVSAPAARAIRHLSGAAEALDSAQTIARLEEVISPADAVTIERRLAEILRRDSGKGDFLRRWMRGIVRIPLWRPAAGKSGWIDRLRGRVLTRGRLAFLGAAGVAAAASLFLGDLPRIGSLIPARAADFVQLWALLTIAAAIHEGGHFLVAAHFGIPCREVGLALFFLQPAAYTDMTDSWLAPRRARVWVAVGGLLFQSTTVLAAYAVWRGFGGDLWLWFCVFSVVYMLLNLLPFVRLDGYWILSHAIEEPNLRPRAIRQLFHLLFRRPDHPVWTGGAGFLGGLFGLTCVLFSVGMYAAGAFGIIRFLPERSRPIGLTLFAVAILVSLSPPLLKRLAGRRRDRLGRPQGAASERGENPGDERASASASTSAAMSDPARRESWFINPFRIRSVMRGTLQLGPFNQTRLRLEGNEVLMRDVLMRDGEVGGEDLAVLGQDTVRKLARKRFLVPWKLGNDERRESRQLGFFSLVQPGDPFQCQRRLEQSTVAVLGLGSVGSQTAYLLAAAGVKNLLVCDFDTVNASNLNRQVLYRAGDVGRRKTEAAAERLREINPETSVEIFERQIVDHQDVVEILSSAHRRPDIVVRAVDYPPGILMEVDRGCHDVGLPSVGGGFVENWAVAGPFLHPAGPCFECMGEKQPLAVASGIKVAIFGPLTFWTASWVAGDVMRYLTALGPPLLTNRALLCDGATGVTTSREFRGGRTRCARCQDAKGRQGFAEEARPRLTDRPGVAL